MSNTKKRYAGFLWGNH